MRPKVVFLALLIGFAVLALVASVSNLFDQQSKRFAQTEIETGSQPELASYAGEELEQTMPAAAVVEPLPTQESALAPQTEILSGGHFNIPSASINSAKPELAAKDIRRRKAELYDLSLRDDRDSLNTLLSEMQNPQKEIREAALQAVVQFDDRSAIPHLQKLAGQTEDAGERHEILAAIDYLKLPSLFEYYEERKAFRLEAGIAEIKPSVFRRQN